MTIGNSRGTRDVAVQDQATEIVDLHLTALIDSATITAPIAINDLTVSINTPTTPLVGDTLDLKDADGEAFYQGEILVVTPTGGDDYDVDLDTPIDFGFSTSDSAELRSKELAVNGAITPVDFSISPIGLTAKVEWDITRLTAAMLSTTSMGDGLFGNLPALTKGIVIRSENGIIKNIFNAKTNGEIKEHSFDLVYADKPPAGQFGLTFRRTFAGQEKNGVVVRVAASTGDGFKIMVQDDLSTLVSFRAVAQGHIVEMGG